MKSLLLIAFLVLAGRLNAQDSLKTHFTLATDVSPFSFGGYSFKAGITPKKTPKMEFALEAFSMEIPEMVINLNSNNIDAGWEEKVDNGIALYIDKKLGSKRSAFWAGAGFVYLNHTAKNNLETNNYQQMEYLARVNYKWFPFEKSNFYVNPYIALAGRHKINGDNGNYALTPFLVIPSFYLSWQL